MKRREFITLLGAAATWPLAARAQQPGLIRTIGVLSGMSNEGQGQIYVKTLRDRLKMLGWIDGQNVRVEYRWASGDASNMREKFRGSIG
jgi:putative ABC transport system substrate-binding protein